MKNTYKLLAVLLAFSVCLTIPVSAENPTCEYENFVYEYRLDSDENATIVSAQPTSNWISSWGWKIPATLDGHTVVAFAAHMYTGTENGLLVYIPVSVVSIGDNAFDNYFLNYENAVVYYGGTESQWATLLANAGEQNDKLNSAEMQFTENGCRYRVLSDGTAWLEYYDAPEGTVEVNFPATLGGRAVTKIGSASIYDGMTLASSRSTIERITFPETVKSIGIVGFSGLPIKELVFPPNVEFIYEEYGFRGCSELESITIPDSLTHYDGYWIAKGADFEGCTALKDVYYGGTKTEWEALELAEIIAPLTDVTVHFGEESGQPGDFDDNGDINMNDALKLYQGVAGNMALGAIFSAMDVNGDGIANMMDALLLYGMVS